MVCGLGRRLLDGRQLSKDLLMQIRRRQNNRVTIAIVAGNAQSATIGTAVAIAPQVRVTRVIGGANVAGARVMFSCSGDSSLSGAGATSLVVVTDTSGLASAPWSMGSVAGTYSLKAVALTASGSGVSFTGTATSASASTITANSVTDQSATVSTAVTAPPSVVVLDGSSNPVSGVSVTFAVTAGGGSIVGGAANTNASGVATCTSWTLGPGAGANTATATSAGLTGSPVTFNANGTAVLPVSIAIQSGGSQSGIVAGSASAAYTFRVKDGSLAGVPGVTVAFTRTVGTGAPSVASAVTDVNGDVSCTYTTGVLVGVNTFTASFVNNSGTTISATETTTSVVGVKSILTITVEPPSNTNSGGVFPGSMVVQIQDANGNLTTSTDSVVITKATGTGTLSGTTSVPAVAGVATFSNLILTGSGAHTLLASSGALATDTSATITVAPPVPAALGIGQAPTSGTTDTALSPAPTCLIQDGNGQTVTGATNAVTVALGDNAEGATLSGTLTVSAIAGIATFSDLTINTVGSYTLIYTSSGLVGVTTALFDIAIGGVHPHEPVGFTQIGSTIDDCNFPSVEAGWGTNGNGKLTVITKAASGFTWPRAITNVVKKDYTGQAGGGSGLNTYKIGLSLSEFYLDYDYCYGSDYTGHTSRTNKMFFLKGSGTGGGNPFYLGYRIVGAQASAQIEFLLQSGIPNVGGNDASGNRRLTTTRGVSRDTPFRLEVYVKLNTADVADGVATMWLDKYDGTGLQQEVTATNMAYRGTGAAVAGGAKIAAFHWDPVYGGTGGSPGTGSTYLGYLYISGKP